MQRNSLDTLLPNQSQRSNELRVWRSETMLTLVHKPTHTPLAPTFVSFAAPIHSKNTAPKSDNDNMDADWIKYKETVRWLKQAARTYDLNSIFYLSLKNQQLHDLPVGFAKLLPHVITLDLSENNLTNVNALRSAGQELACLRTLNLSRNNISDIEPLCWLPALVTLRLEGNCIEDEKTFKVLAKFRHLRALYLQDIDGTLQNPSTHVILRRCLISVVCHHKEYQDQVAESLSDLRVLDGVKLNQIASLASLGSLDSLTNARQSFEEWKDRLLHENDVILSDTDKLRVDMKTEHSTEHE